MPSEPASKVTLNSRVPRRGDKRAGKWPLALVALVLVCGVTMQLTHASLALVPGWDQSRDGTVSQACQVCATVHAACVAQFQSLEHPLLVSLQSVPMTELRRVPSFPGFSFFIRPPPFAA